MVESTGPARAAPHNHPFDHLNFHAAQIEEHFDEEELACVHKRHNSNAQAGAEHEDEDEELIPVHVTRTDE
eukprot:12918865-Prorocentrum_lima.AAC.1